MRDGDGAAGERDGDAATGAPTDAVVVEFLAACWRQRAATGAFHAADAAERFPQHAPALTRLVDALVADAAGPEGDAEHGQRSLGPYRVLRRVDRGGQATVYEAEDPALGRRVALKVLRGGALLRSAALQAFEREARLAARLEDPGLCPIHATGVADGSVWIAMRFFPGPNLRERLQHRRSAGPPPVAAHTRAAVRIGVQLARTVHNLHGVGIVHRDLKPANVTFDERERPIVLDLGLATMRAGDGAAAGGERCGTPAYMAPEQVRGEPADARTDVHALGVMLYEAITLHHPFARAHAATAGAGDAACERDRWFEAVLAARAVPASQRAPGAGVDRDLDAVLAKAIANAPADRYASAAELAVDLEAWLDGRPVHARPVAPLQVAWLWARREPLLAGALAGLVLLLLGGIAVTASLSARLAAKADYATSALQRARAAGLAVAAAQALPGDVALAARLANESFALEHGTAARSVLLTSLRRATLATSFAPLPDPLRLVEASPDGRQIVVGGLRGHAHVVDLASGGFAPLAGGGAPAQAAAWSDAATVVLAQGAELLRRRGGDVERVPAPGAAVIAACADGAGGSWLGDADARLLHWPARAAAPIAVAALPAVPLRLASAPGGDLVVAFGSDRTVRVLGRDGSVRREWRAAAAGLPQLLLAGDRVMTSGDQPNGVCVFEIRTGSLSRIVLPEAWGWLAATADGRHVLALRQRGGVLAADTRTGRVTTTALPDDCDAVAVAPDGSLAGAVAGGAIWIASPAGQLRRFALPTQRPVRHLAFLAEHLVAVTDDGAVHALKRRLHGEVQPNAPAAWRGPVAVADDASLLLAVDGGHVEVDAAGAVAERLGPAGASPFLVLSADGRHVLRQTFDGVARVVTRGGAACGGLPSTGVRSPRFLGGDRVVALQPDGAGVFTLAGESVAPTLRVRGRPCELAVSADGSRFVAAGELGGFVAGDSQGRLLAAASLAEPAAAAAVADDGAVAIGTPAGEIAVFDAHGATTATFAAHDGAVTTLRFLRNGDVLSTGTDGACRRSDRTGAVSWRTALGTGAIAVAESSPDERRLATIGGRGEVAVLDAGSGLVLAQLPAEADPTAGVAFAPRGDALLLNGVTVGPMWLPLDDERLRARVATTFGALGAGERAVHAALLEPR
jgi:tRNA A-37 threonylcarbamoyl transferase component Bud32